MSLSSTLKHHEGLILFEEKETEKDLLSIDSFPQSLQYQEWARQKLVLHLILPCGWQGPQCLDHHPQLTLTAQQEPGARNRAESQTSDSDARCACPKQLLTAVPDTTHK